MPPKTRWFLLLMPMLLGFDFWTKSAARTLSMGERVPVVDGWFALTHAENPYVAFSMPIPFAIIVSFGVIALLVLAQQLWVMRPEARLQAAALAAMASGAVGNLVDRLVDGSVTDMFMLYTDHPALAPWLRARFGTAVWPIFNVADVALLVGVALYLLATATDGDGEVGEAALVE